MTVQEEWQTIIGHSPSGLRYQEWDEQARVLQEGHEVVSPSTDKDGVYSQYQARFRSWMRAEGHPDYQD